MYLNFTTRNIGAIVFSLKPLLFVLDLIRLSIMNISIEDNAFGRDIYIYVSVCVSSVFLHDNFKTIAEICFLLCSSVDRRKI